MKLFSANPVMAELLPAPSQQAVWVPESLQERVEVGLRLKEAAFAAYREGESSKPCAHFASRSAAADDLESQFMQHEPRAESPEGATAWPAAVGACAARSAPTCPSSSPLPCLLMLVPQETTLSCAAASSRKASS